MCLHPRRRQPVDMWTSPHPCGPARAETCGQPVDRAERREKTITRRSSAAHRLPTLSGLSTTYPQAQQQVVFKEDRRGALRNIVPIVDRSKHISPSPCANEKGRASLPGLCAPTYRLGWDRQSPISRRRTCPSSPSRRTPPADARRYRLRPPAGTCAGRRASCRACRRPGRSDT